MSVMIMKNTRDNMDVVIESLGYFGAFMAFAIVGLFILFALTLFWFFVIIVAMLFVQAFGFYAGVFPIWLPGILAVLTIAFAAVYGASRNQN
jgi:hypothetical protein